jgi:serine/threonine-protein kinase RsbW
LEQNLGTEHRLPAMTSIPPGRATLRIGNIIAEMRKVVEFVEIFGKKYELPDTLINDLNLCLDEILNNTISYGYDDDAQHAISIKLSFDGRALVAELQDDARPFDPRRPVARQFSGDLRSRQMGGLGLHFVNALMDEVDYLRTGKYNHVKLKKRLESPSRGEQSLGDHDEHR